ncbi:MAG: hypothetical protein CR988_07805 [Treponema sp.]|nr:MAG: hypothetical protein CR988_07805 [Treponema sp.]
MQIKIKKKGKVFIKNIKDLSRNEAFNLIKESQGECFKIIKQILERERTGYIDTLEGKEWLKKANLSKVYFLKLIRRLKIYTRQEPISFNDVKLEEFVFVCKRLLPDDKLKALIHEAKSVMEIKQKSEKEQENNRYLKGMKTDDF